MHARDERTTDAVDQEAFNKVMRDNLSPEAIAAIIALLQPAGSYRNDTPANNAAINEVHWFRDTLLTMVGLDEFHRLVNEIGL